MAPAGSPDLVVRVAANIEGLKAEMATATASIQKLSDAAVKPATGFFGDLSGQIVKTAAGFVSAQAVIGAVTGAYHELSQFVSDSIHAFSEAEAAEVKLVAALRQHSLATPQVIAQYNDLAATFQRTTIYADEQINAMEALLTQVGGVMPSKMQQALKASTDLAAGLGIDLQSATLLVAKAAAGHTETLGRYGITVSQAAVETKGFDAVLEAVNRQFGGQAQAAVETYAGRIAKLANSWNNFQEAVGKVVVQNPISIAALRGLTDAVKSLEEKSGDTSVSWADLLDKLGAPMTGPMHAIELYFDELNLVASAIERMNAMPSPFKQMADERSLPAITEGMRLFNEQLKADAENAKAAHDEATAMFAAWAAGEKIMEEFGIKTHAIAMKDMHEEAIERKKLLEETNKAVLDAFTHIQTLEQQNTDFVLKQTMSETDFKTLKIHEWEAAQIAALESAGMANEHYTSIVRQNAANQIASLNQVTAAISAQEKALADLARDAVTTFASIGGAASNFRPDTQSAIQAGKVGGSAFSLAAPGGFSLPSFSLSTRQHGGPVSAGQTYLVGEKGPELLHMGANSGMVAANDGGGGPIVVQLVVDGRVLAQVVNDQNTRLMHQGRQWPSA